MGKEQVSGCTMDCTCPGLQLQPMEPVLQEGSPLGSNKRRPNFEVFPEIRMYMKVSFNTGSFTGLLFVA